MKVIRQNVKFVFDNEDNEILKKTCHLLADIRDEIGDNDYFLGYDWEEIDETCCFLNNIINGIMKGNGTVESEEK